MVNKFIAIVIILIAILLGVYFMNVGGIQDKLANNFGTNSVSSTSSSTSTLTTSTFIPTSNICNSSQFYCSQWGSCTNGTQSCDKWDKKPTANCDIKDVTEGTQRTRDCTIPPLQTCLPLFDSYVGDTMTPDEYCGKYDRRFDKQVELYNDGTCTVPATFRVTTNLSGKYAYGGDYKSGGRDGKPPNPYYKIRCVEAQS